MGKTKKLFPKLKKKIGDFLTDESGKISKKDALGLSAGAMLLGAIGEVDATYFSPRSHANGSIGEDSTIDIQVQAAHHWAYCDSTVGGNNPTGVVGTSTQWDTGPNIDPTSNHASGTVNGHYSSNVSVKSWIVDQSEASLSGHASHGSHGSHCSGKFCE